MILKKMRIIVFIIALCFVTHSCVVFQGGLIINVYEISNCEKIGNEFPEVVKNEDWRITKVNIKLECNDVTLYGMRENNIFSNDAGSSIALKMVKINKKCIIKTGTMYFNTVCRKSEGEFNLDECGRVREKKKLYTDIFIKSLAREKGFTIKSLKEVKYIDVFDEWDNKICEAY
jgi:hypothetical protein